MAMFGVEKTQVVVESSDQFSWLEEGEMSKQNNCDYKILFGLNFSFFTFKLLACLPIYFR